VKPEERFEELWMDYLEGELDEAGHAELRTLLVEQEPLRNKAADLYQVHRLLGFVGAASEAESEAFVRETLAHVPRSSDEFVQGIMKQVQPEEGAGKMVPFPSAPRCWHRREWLAAAATIAVTAVGGIFWANRRLRLLSYARVAHNAGAVLVHDGRSLAIGSLLPRGPLTLTQGKLGLFYGCGVQLVVEAPAEFECRDAESMVLHSGRVAAHVPPEAVGFTIETPRGTVIDRGTRFALDTSPQAETQVHVFEGKVDALSHDTSVGVQRLVTGEALGLARQPEALQLRDGAFVHPEELPSVVAGLRVGQYQRWLAWRQAVESDESLVLFAELDPRRLAHGAAAEKMSVAGTRPVQGRWPGKTGLDFNQQGDAVKLNVGGEQLWPQVTLAAWVRLDRLGEPYQSLYHTDGWQLGRPGQVHWMIRGNTKMRLALQGNVIVDAQPGKLLFADSSVPVLPERGRWVHLAVVYDAEGKTARFYLNGSFDNEVRHEVAHPAQLGPAQIGNWNVQDRKLSGRFDELVILGRALADREVGEIFASGNPYA
jgi:hypothetical protein